MPKSKLIKTLTLIVFFTMMSLFVFYRAGMLTSYSGHSKHMLQNSSNGGALPTGSKDTSLKITDSAYQLLLSSSKSSVIFEPNRSQYTLPKRDSAKKTPTKQPDLMSSTKSGIIIRFSDSLPFNYDSIIKTLRKKKKQ